MPNANSCLTDGRPARSRSIVFLTESRRTSVCNAIKDQGRQSPITIEYVKCGADFLLRRGIENHVLAKLPVLENTFSYRLLLVQARTTRLFHLISAYRTTASIASAAICDRHKGHKEYKVANNLLTSSRTCRKDLQTGGRGPACAFSDFPGPSQTLSFSYSSCELHVPLEICETGWSLWRCEGRSSGESACAPPTLLDDRVSRSVEVSRLEMIREAG